MTSTHSFKQGLSKVLRLWRDGQFDRALNAVDELMKSWPGNPRLHVIWASLVQLQDQPTYSLEDARNALERAIELEKDSPAAVIELGHFLDNVDDDPKAASKAFSEGVRSARRLLIDGLLGQAKALLQLEKRDEALQRLIESLYLANVDSTSEGRKPPNGTPDVLVRDPTGHMQAFQLKGSFAMRIEDLLQELLPQRSA